MSVNLVSHYLLYLEFLSLTVRMTLLVHKKVKKIYVTFICLNQEYLNSSSIVLQRG